MPKRATWQTHACTVRRTHILTTLEDKNCPSMSCNETGSGEERERGETKKEFVNGNRHFPAVFHTNGWLAVVCFRKAQKNHFPPDLAAMIPCWAWSGLRVDFHFMGPLQYIVCPVTIIMEAPIAVASALTRNPAPHKGRKNHFGLLCTNPDQSI